MKTGKPGAAQPHSQRRRKASGEGQRKLAKGPRQPPGLAGSAAAGSRDLEARGSQASSGSGSDEARGPSTGQKSPPDAPQGRHGQDAATRVWRGEAASRRFVSPARAVGFLTGIPAAGLNLLAIIGQGAPYFYSGGKNLLARAHLSTPIHVSCKDERFKEFFEKSTYPQVRGFSSQDRVQRVEVKIRQTYLRSLAGASIPWRAGPTCVKVPRSAAVLAAALFAEPTEASKIRLDLWLTAENLDPRDLEIFLHLHTIPAIAYHKPLSDNITYLLHKQDDWWCRQVSQLPDAQLNNLACIRATLHQCLLYSAGHQTRHMEGNKDFSDDLAKMLQPMATMLQRPEESLDLGPEVLSDVARLCRMSADPFLTGWCLGVAGRALADYRLAYQQSAAQEENVLNQATLLGASTTLLAFYFSSDAYLRKTSAVVQAALLATQLHMRVQPHSYRRVDALQITSKLKSIATASKHDPETKEAQLCDGLLRAVTADPSGAYESVEKARKFLMLQPRKNKIESLAAALNSALHLPVVATEESKANSYFGAVDMLLIIYNAERIWFQKIPEKLGSRPVQEFATEENTEALLAQLGEQLGDKWTENMIKNIGEAFLKTF